MRRTTQPNQKHKKEPKIASQTLVSNGKKMECQRGLNPNRKRNNTCLIGQTAGHATSAIELNAPGTGVTNVRESVFL